MGNKLCVTYEMFTMDSTATVISNNQITNAFRINLNNIDFNILTEICKYNNIDEIVLYGPEKVMEKYKQQINTKFTNTIKVTIVD